MCARGREFREQQDLLTQAAQQTDQLSEVLYKNGGASYLQVLTSETNYFSAQLNLVQAQLNERLAWFSFTRHSAAGRSGDGQDKVSGKKIQGDALIYAVGRQGNADPNNDTRHIRRIMVDLKMECYRALQGPRRDEMGARKAGEKVVQCDFVGQVHHGQLCAQRIAVPLPYVV